jgi:hypothetical protein
MATDNPAVVNGPAVAAKLASDLYTAIEGTVVRNGVVWAGKTAQVPRGDSLTVIDDNTVAFRISHKKDKAAAERAILHGKLDFSGLTRAELLQLASAKVLAGNVQRVAAVTPDQKLGADVENRTWSVRAWLNALAAPANREPSVDKAVGAVVSGIDKLTEEQKAALRRALGI